MEVAIGLVGHARAGKTELARALAQTFDAPYVSFGDEVRRLAKEEGGDPQNRRLLMRLGQSWVDARPEDLCRRVLAQHPARAGKPLIIEGIRHNQIPAILDDLLKPRRLLIVFLKAPREVLAERLEGEAVDLAAVESDPTETEIDQLLIGSADRILDASLPTDELAAELVADIARWQRDDTRRAAGQASDTDEWAGLDLKQQAELLNALSTEFGVLVPGEAESRGVDMQALSVAVRAHRALVLDHAGAKLLPAFQFNGPELVPAISKAIEALSERLKPWEIASWFIAGNGWLDDERPIDVDENELASAVEAELAA